MPTYQSPGVYIEEVPSGSMPLSAAGTAVAAFVGFTAKTPNDDPKDPTGVRPRLVTNWGQYTEKYGGFTKSALLPLAVRGFFANGGGRCYIVPIPHREPKPETLALSSGAPEGEGRELRFLNYTESDTVLVLVEPVEPPEDVTPAPKPTFNAEVFKIGADETAETIKAHDKKDRREPDELYKGLSLGEGGSNVATIVNRESKLIQVVNAVEDENAVIALQDHTLEPPTAVEHVPEATFVGSMKERRGVEGLTIADDVTMVMVPDLVTAVLGQEKMMKVLTGKDSSSFFDWEESQQNLWIGVQKAVIQHCQNERNRMAILDPPPDLEASDMEKFSNKAGYDSMFATMYYPWLKVNNPTAANNGNANTSIFVPPCGHMAGIWAKTDETRGVWKAPANESVMDALDVQDEINKLEHDGLNPKGINVIRSFKGRGLKVWGARTLSKTDPSWRYINVRRLFNMIEATIMEGTQWVVFEPNDQALWQRVKRTVDSFLLGLWRDGALFGASAAEAFFVKCDAETNPPESIDEGKLIIEVGIAPVKPAEFVIFRISQKTNTSTA